MRQGTNPAKLSLSKLYQNTTKIGYLLHVKLVSDWENCHTFIFVP